MSLALPIYPGTSLKGAPLAAPLSLLDTLLREQQSTAVEQVTPLTPIKQIVAGHGDKSIVTLVSDQNIVTANIRRVGIVARDGIVPFAADERIVARHSEKAVAAFSTIQ